MGSPAKVKYLSDPFIPVGQLPPAPTSLSGYHLIFFKIFFLLLFKYSCLHSPPTTPPTPAIPSSHSRSYLPLALSVSLNMFLDGPSLFSPYYPSPISSLVTVGVFLISVSLVVFCWLVCFVD